MNLMDNSPEHNDLAALSPKPSVWPIITASGLGIFIFGIIGAAYGVSTGLKLLAIGGVILIITTMGWIDTVIKEMGKHEPVERQIQWLNKGFKLFLLSEGAIFGAFFAHYYYCRFHLPDWPPEGAPELHTTMPALATLILLFSSVICELGHRSLKKGNRGNTKSLILLTVGLGLIFLAFQGYEWGFLRAFDEFTHQSGMFGTLFYIMTGFHGLHVATGIILLLLVYGRLEMGHLTEKFHFSMNVASWYWHFVDVVWILLFFTIFLI